MMKRKKIFESEQAKKGDYSPARNTAAKYALEHIGESHIIEQENAALYEFRKNYKGNLVITSLDMEYRYKNLIKLFINNQKNINYLILNNISTEKKEYFLIDGHPNIDGHKIIAQELYDYILEKNLIPCDVSQSEILHFQ